MSNFISVTCPCGTQFDREVKRGRPAIWCPACRQVPMNQRVAQVKAEGGEVAPVSERVSRFGRNDKFTADQRDQIEANVAEVSAEHRARVADIMAAYPEATTLQEARDMDSAWYSEALKDAYRKVDPSHC